MTSIFLSLLLAASSNAPQFNDKGELQFPANYREWVFLSSGLGMTYGPAAPGAMENPRFDNVFVTPEAYRVFKETGTWPEGTMFVLEIRYSTGKGSINQNGFYQTEVAAIEATVKDSKRFAPNGNKWGFFGFGGGMMGTRATAAALPARASCPACHNPNGAVDSTFVQFYPELLAIAKSKGTVRADFKMPPASPVDLFQQVQAHGWPSGQKLIDEARAQDPAAEITKEPALNQMGFALMARGETNKALAVFAFVTEKFPQSPNAHDSLAEAYEKQGDKSKAVELSRKALSLLDSATGIPDARKAAIRKSSEDRVARLAK